MKKLFTLLLIAAVATTAFAQTPFAINDNGLSVAFCSDLDAADTSYIVHGYTNGIPGHQKSDSSNVSLVDGGLKLEGGGGYWAHVRFKISPDYSSYIDVTADASVSLKYKELNAEAFPLVIRTDASEGFNSYGAELWLEAPDVVVGSSDWNTFTAASEDWFLEDWDPTKVTAFEVALDGGEAIASPSVIIDDIVFGGIELQVCDTAANAQSPFAVNDNGLSVAFCSDLDAADTSYIVHGYTNGIPGHQKSDSSNVSLVDGGLKLEGGGGYWAHVRFKISPDYSSYIDVTADASVSLKYKELNAEAFPLVIRTDASEGFNSYGAELWLEAPDVVVGSSDWNTFTAASEDWFLEDWDPTKVTAFEVALDGGEAIASPSVIIDDIVFGGIELQVCETAANEFTLKPKFDVYPNPADGFLRISNAGQEFDVTFYNVLGRKVKIVQNHDQIDISDLESGLYYVQVSSKDHKDAFKIFVK